MGKMYYKGTTYGGFVAGERSPSESDSADITEISEAATDGDIYVNRSDDVYTISFSGIKLAAALAAGQSVSLFNVTTVLVVEPFAPVMSTVDAGGVSLVVSIAANGVVSIINNSSGSISTVTPINGQINFVGR